MSSESLLKCRFSDSGRGFGFAVPLEETGDDLFIAPDATMGAMTGDTVLVHRYKPGEPGYTRGNEGEVTRIAERGNTEIIGAFRMEGAEGVVTPDNDKLHAVVSVRGSDIGAAKPGDKVAVKITAYPRRRRGEDLFRLEGYVVAVFGRAESREANYAAILHKNGIPTKFSDDAVWEAEDAAARPITTDGRFDFRDAPTLTIDSAEAKDLDDAVSLSREEDGWLLGVHIADVSEYVREGGATDRDAYARGTSVYFVDQVVPMLPTALSNGSCSLNGGVDRYALSAFIHLGEDGIMRSCDFKKTVIRSDVRGVYSEVNDIFENGSASAYAEKYKAVLPMLADMHRLYGILRRAAVARGELMLDSIEPKILLDEKGIPVDIVAHERGDAELMIEQFMLAANIGAATWLHARNLPCLYRVHEDPMPEKIAAFAVFAHNMDLDVSGITGGVSSVRLSRLLDEAKAKGISEPVSAVLLRSLAKARYSDKPGSHYGIAADLYCHFTSPIRRYPDLFVHRAISHALTGSPLPAHPAESAAVTSEAEIRAVTAERQIEDIFMAQYCSFHIGEEYDAEISSVCSFGVFARTDKLFEGLIPVEGLFPAWLRPEYNADRMTLFGGGKTYRLGEKLRVRITRADVAAGKIDLELVVMPEFRRPQTVNTTGRPAFGSRSFSGGGRRPASGGSRTSGGRSSDGRAPRGRAFGGRASGGDHPFGRPSGKRSAMNLSPKRPQRKGGKKK